jgi:hypothetical protein
MISFSVPSQVVLFWFFTLSKRAPDRGQEKVQKQNNFRRRGPLQKKHSHGWDDSVQIQEVGRLVHMS